MGVMAQYSSCLYISRKRNIQLRERNFTIFLLSLIHRKIVGLIKMCLNETYSTVHIDNFQSGKIPI
jgi:hypothetical protein